jgi:hypothetical protein
VIHNNNDTPSLENVILSAIDESISNTHTLLIAKVVKVNKSTIDCKPVVNRVIKGESIELPIFIEVPVIHICGGSSSIRFPIQVGDYCQLFVNERCLDHWYVGSDFLSPLEDRKHDYSDSVAIVGVKRKSDELEIPSVTTIDNDVKANGNWEHNGFMQNNGSHRTTGNTDSGTYSVGGESGASGTFDSDDGKKITVVNGLVTKIE